MPETTDKKAATVDVPAQGSRPAPFQFVLRRASDRRATTLSDPATASPADMAVQERDKARQEIALAMSDLLNRWANEGDDAERNRLRAEFDELAERQMNMLTADFRRLLEQHDIQELLATLRSATAELQGAVAEMRKAKETSEHVARVLALADRVIGIFLGARG